MRRSYAWAGGLVLGMGLLAATPAHALITRPTPLRGLIDESVYILTARVEAVDPSRPAMVLTADEDLKGKVPFRKLAVNLKGDPQAVKYRHVDALLKRVAPGLPLVLFVRQQDKNFFAFACTNGTWFQLEGTQADDEVRWSFTHCEPYL